MRSKDNRKLPNIIKEADAEAIRRYSIHPEGTSVFEALPSVNMYTEVQKALQEAKYAYPLMVTTGTQPLLLTGLEDKEALLLTYVATQADQKELDAAADRVIPMVNNLILHTSNNHASTDLTDLGIQFYPKNTPHVDMLGKDRQGNRLFTFG
jgi:hypothetical protein